MPGPLPESDSESLSALSDVDEKFLHGSERLLKQVSQTKKTAGRKMNKTSGVDLRDKTHGRTALHRASARGILEKMIELIEEKQATIDITDNAGVTPLHDACTAGHIEAVRYLIKAGATVSPKDCEGDYPLLDAAQNDNQQICQILLDAGANPTMQNSKGMSALSEAEEGPLKDLLREYSSRFDSPGQNRMRITDVLTIDNTPRAKTVVDKAASHRLSDRARLRQIRSTGINIDSQGARKVDLNGRDQLHQYVLQAEDDLVEQYLEIQECDYQDNYGDTPLHAAARSGNAHICGLLLQHGAKIKLRNRKGNTALHEACSTADSREVIVALLDAGASSLAKNSAGLLPSDIAHAELGAGSQEYRLLLKTVTKERQKAEDKERKRSVKRERNSSASGSARSTPVHSPQIQHDAKVSAASPLAAHTSPHPVPSKSVVPDSSQLPQEIAITVATSTAPQIISTTKQVVSSGLPTTQFLTELKSKRFPSQNDSSIRGSPLPSAPREENSDRISHLSNHSAPAHQAGTAKRKGIGDSGEQSPKRPRKDSVEAAGDDATTLAIAKMGADIVSAIDRQNTLLSAVLTSINALVAAQRK